MAIKISGTTIIDDSRNITNAGIITATSFVGNLTANSANIGSAVGINSDGINVVGIVTATSLSLGDVTISSAGLGIATAGGNVGSGVTFIDLRGAGISTVTVSSGIATINVEGGGGGGGTINLIGYIIN